MWQTGKICDLKKKQQKEKHNVSPYSFSQTRLLSLLDTWCGLENVTRAFMDTAVRRKQKKKFHVWGNYSFKMNLRIPSCTDLWRLNSVTAPADIESSGTQTRTHLLFLPWRRRPPGCFRSGRCKARCCWSAAACCARWRSCRGSDLGWFSPAGLCAGGYTTSRWVRGTTCSPGPPGSRWRTWRSAPCRLKKWQGRQLFFVRGAEFGK